MELEGVLGRVVGCSKYAESLEQSDDALQNCQHISSYLRCRCTYGSIVVSAGCPSRGGVLLVDAIEMGRSNDNVG